MSIRQDAVAWRDPEPALFAVLDPANGDIVGQAPDATAKAMDRAIGEAQAALPGWSALLARERAARLRAWREALASEAEVLAQLITREQGKPLAESRGEVAYGLSFIDWFAEEAGRLEGVIIPSHLHGASLSARPAPLGVAAAITPWNFPFAMITRKAAAALAAGCTVVVKPSPETPLTAIAIAAAASRAGLGDGILAVVTGRADALGEQLCLDPRVKVVSFTGSTVVGRKILSSAAGTIKRVLLELGGHAPFIVFADADLDRAVADCVAAKFVTSGQDCLAANRIFVHRDVHDAFVERFVAAVKALRLGHGLEPDVDLGPLIHEGQVDHCLAQIADAVGRGARVLTGGARDRRGSTFLEPTVLTGVDETMRIFREETFGPVAPILVFDDEDEVVARANDSLYGLAAYIQTADQARAVRVQSRLAYGMTAVNTASMTGPPVPFGGLGQSGLGREGSHQGVRDFTDTKYLCLHHG